MDERDVVEALAEWVLSKNLQPKENIANSLYPESKRKEMIRTESIRL